MYCGICTKRLLKDIERIICTKFEEDEKCEKFTTTTTPTTDNEQFFFIRIAHLRLPTFYLVRLYYDFLKP